MGDAGGPHRVRGPHPPRARHRPALRGALGAVLVEPSGRSHGQGAGDHPGRRVRARGHPSACRRQIPRHADRLREARRDAHLPRQRHLDRSQLAVRPRAQDGAQREPRTRDPRAAHHGCGRRLHAGRCHRARHGVDRMEHRARDPARQHRLRQRTPAAAACAGRTVCIRVLSGLARTRSGEDAGQDLRRRGRAPGRDHARRPRETSGDRAFPRPEVRAPLRQRRSVGVAGQTTGRCLSRPRHLDRRDGAGVGGVARGLDAGETQAQTAGGLRDLRAARCRRRGRGPAAVPGVSFRHLPSATGRAAAERRPRRVGRRHGRRNGGWHGYARSRDG